MRVRARDRVRSFVEIFCFERRSWSIAMMRIGVRDRNERVRMPKPRAMAETGSQRVLSLALR